MGPLILDPMSQEVKESMRTKVKITKAPDRTGEQVCEEILDIIRDPDTGKVCIPKAYLWGALMNGGEHVPYKARMNISTASSPGKSRKSRLPSFFRIEAKRFPIFDEDGDEPKWEVLEDVGNGQTSKNETCRPEFEDWGFDMIFQYDEGEVNEKTIRALFSEAGKKSGIGCKRAGQGYDNGQFMVTSWEDITPRDWPQAKEIKVDKKSRKKSDSTEPESSDGETEEQ
jgi:hypothetical protein